MNHVDAAQAVHDDHEAMDIEVFSNYLVQPYGFGLAGNYQYERAMRRPGYSVLKSPDTNTIVDTLVGTLAMILFPTDSFVRCIPVGTEDPQAADVFNRLIARMYRMPGAFRSKFVGLKQAALFGTHVDHLCWEYQETEMPVRTFKQVAGYTSTSSKYETVSTYDDPRIVPLDHGDFMEQAGKDTVAGMTFAAHRFEMLGNEAEEWVARGRFRKAETARAIATAGRTQARRDRDFRQGLDRPASYTTPKELLPMIGYEGYGETPHMNPDRRRRRRITVLNGELVESRPMPYAISRLPYHETVFNPILGRFRGLAPAEAMRHLQDFIDGLFMCMADATMRAVYPRLVVGMYSQITNQTLQDWKPDNPIRTVSPDQVRELKYSPPSGEAFQMLQGARQQAKEQTGAIDAVQGLGLGVDRPSATYSSLTYEKAGVRPEMLASLIERETLPAEARTGIELCQQMIEDEEDLHRRVGNTKLGVPHELTDLSAEYDVTFVGSRRTGNQAQRAQALERIMQTAGQIPGVAPTFPWAPVFAEMLTALGVWDVEALMENEEQQMKFIQRAQLMGMTPGKPGSPPSPQPAGYLPAQTAGAAGG